MGDFFMKQLKREITLTKLKIVFLILLLIGSAFVYKNNKVKNYFEVIDESKEDNIVLDVDAKRGFILNSFYDKSSFDNNIKITLSKLSSEISPYSLALLISKDFDYSLVKALINNEEYSLADLLISDDENYNYFIIDENKLMSEKVIYRLSFYIDEKNSNCFNNGKYDIEFMLL